MLPCHGKAVDSRPYSENFMALALWSSQEMLLLEGRYFQPHSPIVGQRRKQELKLLNEAELKNLQAIKKKLLDPLSNHPLCLLTLSLIVIFEVHFQASCARASYCNSHW